MVIRTITGGTDETVTASGVANPPSAPGRAGERNEGVAGTAIPGRRSGWRHDEGMIRIRSSTRVCVALDVAVGCPELSSPA
jgi:hypothetical protein